MKKITAGLVGLALLGLCIWRLSPGPPSADGVAPAVRSGGPEVAMQGPPGGGPVPPTAQELRGARREVVELPVAAGEAGADAATSRIFGRVVDASGTALIGVEVQLRSVGGQLAEGVEDQETLSDAAGAFGFEVPVPTSDWVSLYIRPDSFHDIAGREFGPAGGRDEDPIAPGDNDLGTFVLTATGAIAGTVRDPLGNPIEGAVVSVSTRHPGSYSRNAVTGPDGSYRIGHVHAGRFALSSHCQGFVKRGCDPVSVELEQVTRGVDFTLEPSPTITGRVVNEEGIGLADVRLWGWPVRSGRGSGARTGADGTFTIHLAQVDPLTRVEASLKGYETWNSGRETCYEPGTEGLEIVLTRPTLTALRVVDETTGAPVERFAMYVVERPTRNRTVYSNPRTLEIADRPDGRIDLAAHSDMHDYRIRAPGYAPRVGQVEPAEEGGAAQEIRLVAGARIAGRVVQDDRGVPRPVLRLERDRFQIDPDLEEDEEDWFSDNWTFDLDEFCGMQRQVIGGIDGCFEIRDLPAGTWELTYGGRQTASSVLERIRLEAGSSLDLGDLAVTAGASLEGRILLPPGYELGGIFVGLGSNWIEADDAMVATDASGGFRFEHLAAGTHQLHVQVKHGVLLGGVPIPVELAPDQVLVREFDLSHRAAVDCALLVRVNGSPRPGLQASIGPREARQEEGEWDGGESWEAEQAGPGWTHLGACDSAGWIRGDCPRLGAALVSVTSGENADLGTFEVQIEDAGPNEFELEVSAGDLVISLPPEFQLDPTGSQTLAITRPDSAVEEWEYPRHTVWLRNEQLSQDGSLTLGPLLPGPCRIGYWEGGTFLAAEGEVIAGQTAHSVLAPSGTQ